ncbi:hypothetical protein [Anaerorudis cellulosivorans]|uniref:hypothetical protein n=1 Tax=Anaerorudis cellulosivorans TaxID=3397862 RepID=UPI00221EA623|nr:hypothetical protein [Seramator thermalis]MCW1735101.1 hypothetical protein [Seramator thermalis]
MSSLCPLCGKNKSEEALFCDECEKKIRNEYEVEMPGQLNFAENASQPAAGKEVVEVDEALSFSNTQADSLSRHPKRGKRKGIVLGCVFAIGVSVAFSFVYKQYAERQTREQLMWEEAASAHTVNAYLAYMNAYPNGKYVANAEAEMKALKDREASAWEKVKTSEDIADCREFLRQYPDSPYRPLVSNRLDSLMWIDAYTANTAQRYSEYMVAVESGELPGNYYHEAQKRFEMLFQSYPVLTEESDKIKGVIEGFYGALSDKDYNKLAEYLAPKVYRFFNKGTDSRDNILKGLQLAKAKNPDSAVRFIPNLEALQYEKTPDDRVRVNVPLVKQYGGEEGATRTVSGYIGHIEMDGEGRVVSIYETKPYGAER